MWTQRDQIQAYQFLRRRLVSALVAADANHPTSPSRRLVLGTLIGVAAGVLIAAVFGILGLLNPSSSADWQHGGQVIVEQQTGTRYVLGGDHLLHPMLNYTSALLAAGGNGQASTVTMSSAKLSAASRGAMEGIVGAPDSLPAAGKLTDSTFVSCSRKPADLPVAAPPIATLILGAGSAGGQDLGARQGMVVGVGSAEFLLAGGHSYRLPDQTSAAALGYAGAAVVPVSQAWLDTVPAGQDLGVITVAGSGDPGPNVGAVRTSVGDVLDDGSGNYYLVVGGALRHITRTEELLALASPDYPDPAHQAVRVPVAAAAGMARSGDNGGTPAATSAGYPLTPPSLTGPGPNAVLCAVGDGQDNTRLVVAGALPLPKGATVMPVTAGSGDMVADEIYVAPGTGVLATEAIGNGGSGSAEYLITDAGTKYPMGPAAAKLLGYAGVSPQRIAGTLLDLLPTGPALDPAAAHALVGSAGGGR
ncbi:MAG TPA: type VII secretion protein EccB [Pseudonocardiaceae bacterium]|nr:type VII secretion protein EccB [Pseudonocardiaceae bacterium]